MVKALQPLGAQVEYVQCERKGKNALDFHLSFYMGYIAARHPDARFVVLSNDKGYAPMIEHAAELGFATRQLGFGARAVAARAPSRRGSGAAAPRTTTAKRTPAKTVAPRPATATTSGAAVKKTAAKKAAPAKSAERKTSVATKKAAAPPQHDATVAAGAPVARKPAARKKATPPAKTATPETTGTAARRSAATAASGAQRRRSDGRQPHDGLTQSVEHVVASLRKTRDKPTRQARLLTTIRSLLGAAADEAMVQAVLAQLLERGLVTVDAKGAVRFAL